MANSQENTVLLRVQLDEGKTEAQLGQIVLSIEATKKAQIALNAERKAGKVTDEEFAAQTVKLRTELRALQTEETSLTKNLSLYRQAVNGVADSYSATQAALSLAQRQYQDLAGSATNSTEATQELSGVVRDLRGVLKETDASGLDQFFRNIGNYKADGLQGLVQQLVKLQEEQKHLTEGSKEYNRAQMQIVGFQTQAMQAAA